MAKHAAPQCLLRLLALSCCVLLAAAQANDTMGSEILELPTQCATKLEAIWNEYYTNETSAAAEACRTTLQTALSIEGAANVTNCPTTNATVTCFLRAEDDWNEYVTECELFHFTGSCPTETEAGEAAEGEAATACVGASTSTTESGEAAEGEASSTEETSPGCFPKFRNSIDFHSWLEGELDLAALTEEATAPSPSTTGGTTTTATAPAPAPGNGAAGLAATSAFVMAASLVLGAAVLQA